MLSITPGVLFVLYLLWAFIPDATLRNRFGVFYYPDKYWAIAVPVWVFVFGLYGAWAYEGVNLMSVKPIDHEDLVREVGGSIPVGGKLWVGRRGRDGWKSVHASRLDPPGSVPSIHDVSLEEVNRVLFRSRGGGGGGATEEGYVAKLRVIPDGSLHKTRRRLFRR
jgi:phosphatidylinositol glycan class P protein